MTKGDKLYRTEVKDEGFLVMTFNFGCIVSSTLVVSTIFINMLLL